MTKAVAKKQNTEMMEYEWEDDEGVDGDFDPSDVQIPYLAILQALSPQVQDEVEGCKPGELFNTVTGEVFSGAEGVLIQPCYLTTVFVEWHSRESGGGLVARHDPSSDFVREAVREHGKSYGKIPVPGADTYLQETKYLYALMMDEDGETAGFAILSFTGSKLKKLRKFMTSFKMLRGRPKLFQIMARVKTEKEKNDLGTFYNYAMTIEKTLTKEHDAAKIGEGYEFAKRVRDMDYADPEPDTQPDMAEPKKELVDDEIPF